MSTHNKSVYRTLRERELDPKFVPGHSAYGPPPPPQARFADIQEPLEALLLWAMALKAEAPTGLCALLGLRDFDSSALTDRQRRQLEELKAMRIAEEIFSREELGRMLRAQFGMQIGRCDCPKDMERLARAAARLPVWVFDPELAALEDSARTAKATQVRMESEVARDECKARKLEARARAGIAKEAIANPRSFSSAMVKSAAGGARHADAAEPEAQAPGAGSSGAEGMTYGEVCRELGYGPDTTLEEMVSDTKRLIEAIELEKKYARIHSEVVGDGGLTTNHHLNEITRRLQEE